ncbi:MAG TPA: hypothetical protein VHN19_12595 [Burkholderiales bacterium]|nr:hypothetical protein [Burkholderiales bacterium]
MGLPQKFLMATLLLLGVSSSLFAIDEQDKGIYLVVNTKGEVTTKSFRVSQRGSEWIVEDRKSDGSWVDVTCESDCMLKVSSESDVRRFFTESALSVITPDCMHNKAFAFCGYSLKTDYKFRGYLLVALTQQQPIVLRLARVVPDKKQNSSDKLADLAKQGYSVTTVTPVYSQLVAFAYPRGFKPAFAKDSGPNYIQEYVPEGEALERWSQIITMTGVKGLAANQAVTPQRVVEQIASGFQRACPSSFSVQPLGALKISGYDGFVAVFGCGTVSTGSPRSEIAIVLAVKGAADYYTFQWAERAQQSAQRPVLDGEKWLNKLKQLNPIKICDRIPNEAAPYPSCINQK